MLPNLRIPLVLYLEQQNNCDFFFFDFFFFFFYMRRCRNPPPNFYQAILWAPNTQSELTTPRKYYPKNSNPVLGHPLTAHQFQNSIFFDCFWYFCLVSLLVALKILKNQLSSYIAKICLHPGFL